MNKQEVIDEIEEAIPDFSLNDYQRGKETGLTYALELVRELDEPEKPPVPQYIADYIDSEQYSYSTLSEAIDNMDDEKEVLCWFYDNSETFAKAWLFGYTAKKYKVSFKKNGFSVGVQQRDGSVKAVFTKDELAEYGFNNLDEYDVTEVEE